MKSLCKAAGATALCSVSGRAARHPAQGAGPALPVPAGHAGQRPAHGHPALLPGAVSTGTG
ncbi:unnamed protein product [Gulo gulo]|uniref:Uncharacterized protein n=1 Tax=Gulo gulo TaxID=48420 RepID=A0A9X9LEJ1_GULGU|nr:unnamed protein product [Gulo gulo]